LQSNLTIRRWSAQSDDINMEEVTKRPKTGGRQRGTKNKSTVRLEALLRLALKREGGVEYMQRIARDFPVAFCGMLARLIPSEIIANVDATLRPAREVTDLDAARRIAFLLTKGAGLAEGAEQTELRYMLPMIDVTPPPGGRMTDSEMRVLCGQDDERIDDVERARVEAYVEEGLRNRDARRAVSREELLRPEQGLRPESPQVLLGRRPKVH
jgi:hypothetical protein